MIRSRFEIGNMSWVQSAGRALATWAVMLLCLLGGCVATPSSHDAGIVASRADSSNDLPAEAAKPRSVPPPLVVVTIGPGENSYHLVGGIVFAAWEDGRVMRSAFPNRVTNQIVQGRMSPAQLDTVRIAALALSEHVPGKGHACCGYQSVRINDGPAKGVYTHAMVKGRTSPAITAFIDAVWKLEIADAKKVKGAQHGRHPNSRLADVYPGNL